MIALLIDDNPTNLMLLKHRLIKIEGCEVVCMESALDALAWCEANTPDIILTDYMMPGMDGLDFIRQVRRREEMQDVPVVVVTTSDVKEIRQQALDLGAADFLTKPVDGPELMARTRNLLALRQSRLALHDRAAEELVMRLSKAAEYRDPETGAHIERMARYSALIARRMGLPNEAVERLELAAPMHDVGKVGIPDMILLKPDRLSETEFTIMKQHAMYGWEILKDSSSQLVRLAALIARTHHEKFDGSGYPEGLAGDKIPLEGRIVAVADVFDALTSTRPYKTPWPVDKAAAFLGEQKGCHFDPACVDAFLSDLGEVLRIKAQFLDHGDEAPPHPLADY
ncbi:HD domain-containing phosphohydrolase [Paramagnetospirillum magneticum]|uniref:Response regulator containing a CheY-like receiver domain and an HD-GYP domain n=1 Tax=Paramagnetospirillum magneticum (strain ATCC 700264 / AMB-1) TaxID=342108 RepID=Q2W1N2_PARM1|nr:HD domain-containing phosphohydrolase [Paramagnetospirillum magneticum]BAE52243.1 Response regulator containing a CheY-like receiver domain and an HD-GYP domain [Paramagnetospirillum magneticum AMB-1]